MFLFPWAVSVYELALFGLIEMVVFLAILVTGYAYAGRKARSTGPRRGPSNEFMTEEPKDPKQPATRPRATLPPSL